MRGDLFLAAVILVTLVYLWVSGAFKIIADNITNFYLTNEIPLLRVALLGIVAYYVYRKFFIKTVQNYTLSVQSCIDSLRMERAQHLREIYHWIEKGWLVVSWDATVDEQLPTASLAVEFKKIMGTKDVPSVLFLMFDAKGITAKFTETRVLLCDPLGFRHALAMFHQTNLRGLNLVVRSTTDPVQEAKRAILSGQVDPEDRGIIEKLAGTKPELFSPSVVGGSVKG